MCVNIICFKNLIDACRYISYYYCFVSSVGHLCTLCRTINFNKMSHELLLSFMDFIALDILYVKWPILYEARQAINLYYCDFGMVS